MDKYITPPEEGLSDENLPLQKSSCSGRHLLVLHSLKRDGEASTPCLPSALSLRSICEINGSLEDDKDACPASCPVVARRVKSED